MFAVKPFVNFLVLGVSGFQGQKKVSKVQT